MTFLSQRVYGDILLLVQHYIVEVDITVDCSISGNKDDFVYESENTLYKFIEDLQEVGMAWAKKHQPHGAGITVDGRPGHPIGFTGTSHPFSTAFASNHSKTPGSFVDIILRVQLLLGGALNGLAQTLATLSLLWWC